MIDFAAVQPVRTMAEESTRNAAKAFRETARMKRLYGLLGVAVFVAGCTSPAPAPAPAPAAPTAQPYASLAQVMRGIPFPNSNIIFDTQTTDPGAPKKPGDAGAGASAQYNSVYGGWQAVENAALAISETANLIMIPGRLCE